MFVNKHPIEPVPEAAGTASLGDLENLAKAVGPPRQSPLVGELAQDPSLLQDFLTETRDHLANIETQLLALELNPSTQDSIHAAFRSFHTIKGLAGFMELNVIQQVAHETESLLDKARNGELALGKTVIDSVLAAGDYLAQWIRYIESWTGGTPGPEPDPCDRLVGRIRLAASTDPGTTASAPDESPISGAAGQGGGHAAAATVKVDTGKLEYLVDMVGELVIAQALVRHDPHIESGRIPRLQRNLAQLARVTSEVQKTAMAMRMVPVGHLFRRMQRLVRDLSHKFGKAVELEIEGEDVELDRTIVEELSDPMVHMIRNSLDHGIESPAERETAGKPKAGKVRLAAMHRAGQIVIEVSDDGRGLDRNRILAKAVQRQLVDPEATLADRDVFALIFEPGFSTADRITDVSGRGVGMDVVRKQVERLRGRVEITSTPGHGTCFQMNLPLTLAIIDGLVVMAGGERFIVPVFAVREMFRPSPECLFTVEGKGEMALVRGHLLTLIRLHRRLGLSSPGKSPSEGLLIVGEAEGKTYCLLVDELLGKQEVVIKSLGNLFQKVDGIAGGAILGDGRVGLILDMTELYKGQHGSR